MKKFRNRIGIVCIMVMLVCLTACGSSVPDLVGRGTPHYGYFCGSL